MQVAECLRQHLRLVVIICTHLCCPKLQALLKVATTVYLVAKDITLGSSEMAAYLMQVAERLRQDPRLVVIDRTNLRYLKLQDLPGETLAVDLVSLDLSFISVLKVLPAVIDVLRPGGGLIVLIKPQFEADRDQVILR